MGIETRPKEIVPEPTERAAMMGRIVIGRRAEVEKTVILSARRTRPAGLAASVPPGQMPRKTPIKTGFRSASRRPIHFNHVCPERGPRFDGT